MEAKFDVSHGLSPKDFADAVRSGKEMRYEGIYTDARGNSTPGCTAFVWIDTQGQVTAFVTNGCLFAPMMHVIRDEFDEATGTSAFVMAPLHSE